MQPQTGRGLGLSMSEDSHWSRSIDSQTLSADSPRPRTFHAHSNELSTSTPRSRSFHVQAVITDKPRPCAGRMLAVPQHSNWPWNVCTLTTSFPPCCQINFLNYPMIVRTENLVLPRRDQRTLRFDRAPSSARSHSACARRERHSLSRCMSVRLPSAARRRRCGPVSFC